MTRRRNLAELALVLTFVEAICAGAASAPLATLLTPFTDAELLASGSPYPLEALRLAYPSLPRVLPSSLAWLALGLIVTILARSYVYRRTAALARWRTEGRAATTPFVLFSLGATVAKFVLLATLVVLTASLARASPLAWSFGLGAAALLLGLHACIAAWLDGTRALVSVGVSPLRALARGTCVAASARLVALRAGLAVAHVAVVPLGYLAVALTEGGLSGVVASATLQGLLFSLCFAEVLWIRALGEPLGLTGRTTPSEAHTTPSASGA